MIDPTGEFPLDLTTYFFHLLTVVGRYRDAKLEELLRPMGLSLSRQRALTIIAHLSPCTMSELADFAALDRTTMTRIVDQLVGAGLVERATPKKDRRQVLLTLTPRGMKLARETLKASFRCQRPLLGDIDETDQRQAARTLERVLANLVDDPRQLERLQFRSGGRG